MKFTHKPLDIMYITQPFAVDWTRNGLYRRIGLKGHNGLDLRSPNYTPFYAVFDGFIKDITNNQYAGWWVEINSLDNKWRAYYGHLIGNRIKVKKGDHVVSGQVLGLTDTSGRYAYGAHLHFGIKPLPYDSLNGFNGAVDPLPFMPTGFEKLPVDERYGRDKDQFAEWKFRFAPEAYVKKGDPIARAGHFIHRQLISRFKKPPLDGQMTNAILYGAWPYHMVFDDAYRPIWMFLKYEEFKAGKKPPIPVGVGGSKL